MRQIVLGDYTVIVRSVGERTEEKCIERLEHFFGTKDIKVVKNIFPFTAAIRKCFETAIKDGKKWCWIVDADLFFYDERLRIFFENCNRIRNSNENAFCFQAYCYDNFFGECRVGMHLYSTKWLKSALPYVDNDKGRPESWIIRNMGWQGYPCYVVEMCIGIHDFFQSYRDIVAKGMLHACKHSAIESLIVKWKKENNKEDYYWILEGVNLIRSIKTSEQVKVDASYYRRLIEESGLVFPRQDALVDEQIDEVLNEVYEIEPYHEMPLPLMTNQADRKTLSSSLLYMSELIKNKVRKHVKR